MFRYSPRPPCHLRPCPSPLPTEGDVCACLCVLVCVSWQHRQHSPDVDYVCVLVCRLPSYGQCRTFAFQALSSSTVLFSIQSRRCRVLALAIPQRIGFLSAVLGAFESRLFVFLALHLVLVSSYPSHAFCVAPAARAAPAGTHVQQSVLPTSPLECDLPACRRAVRHGMHGETHANGSKQRSCCRPG